MEQTRFFLAIALSFLVFIVWNVFFAPQDTPQKPNPQPAIQSEHAESDMKKAESPTEKPATADALPVPETPPAATVSQQNARTVTVTTPLYSVKISEKGAVFTSFVLEAYREKADKNSPLKELIPADIAGGNLQAGFENNSVPGIENAIFAAAVESDTTEIRLQQGSKAQTVSFLWTSPQGVAVEKKFVFSPDSYLIGLTVNIKNGSATAVQDSLTLSLTGTVPTAKNSYGFEGPSALLNNSLEQIKIDDIKDKNIYTGSLKWMALESHYFMSGIIPVSPADTNPGSPATMRLSVKSDHLIESRYVCPAALIGPGASGAFDFNLFFGPKSLKVLNKLNNNLDKAINFGWFDFIAKPCLWLLNFLYGFIPNYGVAIIILTVLVKAVLWPLGNISYKSMNEMKKIQPLMTEIREKYKDDKQRMNQEVMNLYKTYKINPMGGCLPMVAQIPVFFALYRMLYDAIELRHAPFFGWINDLSAPDRLFPFDMAIPFMEPPYGIPVLTIIMGATMLLQQKMSPPPGDPAQAKMMMFMPVIFTVIFINFSSGLVLYWLINNILSISQQYYVSKKKA
ncbi:MAG: membrane protein insertase YidC [Desulfobacteraceae bacterium IS3]|nr:MAG: membrane protein insertase YidC [Desulfobacteraceae bacterium IS3]